VPEPTPGARPCPLARPCWCWRRRPGGPASPSRPGTIPDPHEQRIMSGLLLQHLIDFLHYLTQVREAALPGLGEDEATIHCHLEATATAGDQGQAFDAIAIAVKKLLRRPGGSKEVVSRHAVLDLNGQFLGHFLSFRSLDHLERPLAVHVSPDGGVLQPPRPSAKQSSRHLV
jgi:hypothetical protein